MFQFSRLARVILEPDARVATGLLLAFVALLPGDLALLPAKTSATPGPSVRIR